MPLTCYFNIYKTTYVVLLPSKVKAKHLFQRCFGSYFLPLVTSLLTTREAFKSISLSRDEPGVLKLRGNPLAASIEKENRAEHEKGNRSVKLVLLFMNVFGVAGSQNKTFLWDRVKKLGS